MAIATLRAELESERSGLQQVDASIKRIVQTPIPRSNHERYNNMGEVLRGRGAGPGAEEAGKRRHDTKTVFSRLSRPDSDSEEPALHKKPRLSSHVTRDLPSKQEILKVQCGDEEAKVRSRRMFGSLLGTLQRFRRDELDLRSREEKKAQVEKRIEMQALHEKEQHKRERQLLFAERETRKARIKALEAKLARAGVWEEWAAAQRPLAGFLRTRARPPLCWAPRVAHPRTDKLLQQARHQHHEMMEKKRKELEEELIKIEEKCLRSAKNHDATQDTKENKTEQSGSDEDTHTNRPTSLVRVKQENGTSHKKQDETENQERDNLTSETDIVEKIEEMDADTGDTDSKRADSDREGRVETDEDRRESTETAERGETRETEMEREEDTQEPQHASSEESVVGVEWGEGEVRRSKSPA